MTRTQHNHSTTRHDTPLSHPHPSLPLPLQPYEKEIDQKGISGGIVVPLLPFGIKKYDEVGGGCRRGAAVWGRVRWRGRQRWPR